MVMKTSDTDKPCSQLCVSEYLSARRKEVLSNYYTNVKEEEILNFRRIVTQERQRLQSKMRNFELESADIQEKLKENDRAAIEAIVKAEEQVKKRIAKEEELKCLKSQLLKVQAEISRNKIRLHDYQSYQRFLESLVPEPQRSERLNQMKVKQKENMADKENHQKQVQIEQSFAKDVEGITMATSEKSDLQKIFKKSYETVDENTQSRQADVLGTVLKAVIKFQRRLQVKSTARTSPIPPEPQENEISSDEQIGLDNYFKEPHELITVLKDLEVANLSLIQNCQDAEDTIESLRKGEELLNKQSLKETEDVKTRMKQLEEIISQWNNDLSQDGMPEPDEGEAKQDKQFAELCEQIADVYNTCGLQKLYPISENEEAPLRALEQFARIDAHVAFLLTSVASSGASEERVEALRREVRAARREKLRQEQREAERAKQEERARRALLRARAPAPAKKAPKRVDKRLETKEPKEKNKSSL